MESPLTPLYRFTEYKALRAYQFFALRETTHAIFTRLGGVSPSPWVGLNFGSTVGDAPENVSANFALACNALGIKPAQTATTRQVHGKEVVVARASDGGAQYLGDADAMITREKGVYLTMRFADCVPLLFFDPVIGAVGAAHAGWRAAQPVKCSLNCTWP
jgi:copper oxidase (laccase) domain-containing protein